MAETKFDPLSIGAVGLPIAGGILGNIFSGSDRKKQDEALQAALAAISGINVPTIEEQRIALEHPELVGEYQSVLEESPEALGRSGMEDIETDPRLRAAQMNALETLSRLGETGMTDTEAAQLDQIKRQAGASSQATQNQILQNLAQRGIAGSGQELAARMIAGQQQADLASQQGMQTAAQAQERALAAIAQAGSLGGQMRGQEFGEKSDVARATDSINQFNLQQRLGQRQRNVGEQRYTQNRNLTEKQRIADAGTAASNAQEEYNQQLIRQHYQDQLAKGQAMAGQQTGMANHHGQQAAATAGSWSQIGGGVGAGLGQLSQQQRDDDRYSQMMDLLRQQQRPDQQQESAFAGAGLAKPYRKYNGL